MSDEKDFCLPEKGERWPSLAARMKNMAVNDLDWRHGRHGAYVWYVDDELEEVLRGAYSMFISENGLNTKVFPSLARMEAELVGVALKALGHPGGFGHLTSGGTESIFLATFAAREWTRKHRPDIVRPNIVAPFSAHPAINKSAYYLGIEVVRVPVGLDYRADPTAMEAAINENTIMLYSSAPAYSLGIIDPISALGALAERRGLWLHVDACVGGILAPFVRNIGYPVPAFDFTVPGVTSMSADLHKSGFCAKGASMVLFRDKEHQECSRYGFAEWPHSAYSTLTFTGTRPGGAIAASWAVQQYLGMEGYRRIAGQSMQARERFEKGLKDIEGFRVFGKPELWAVGFGAPGIDITLVQRLLLAAGWRIGGFRSPDGLHMMFTPVHLPFVDEMLEALRNAVRDVRNGMTMPEVSLGQVQYS